MTDLVLAKYKETSVYLENMITLLMAISPPTPAPLQKQFNQEKLGMKNLLQNCSLKEKNCKAINVS